MSLFSFFSRKTPSKVHYVPDSSGLGHVDATQPLMPGEKLAGQLSVSAAVDTTGNRKSERHGQRELLYNVVRDTMVRAGVLAASYKFKVLSLDTRGRQYLIMMDLMNGSAGAPARLAEIEAMLAQAAKQRHDILVTAVYWRVSAQVTAGLSAPPNLRSTHPPVGKPVSMRPRLAAALPDYEPLQQDEIAAFKRAVDGASTPPSKSVVGRVVTSGRRNPSAPVEFQDTQVSPTAERPSPLSVTQYGDLN